MTAGNDTGQQCSDEHWHIGNNTCSSRSGHGHASGTTALLILPRLNHRWIDVCFLSLIRPDHSSSFLYIAVILRAISLFLFPFCHRPPYVDLVVLNKTKSKTIQMKKRKTFFRLFIVMWCESKANETLSLFFLDFSFYSKAASSSSSSNEENKTRLCVASRLTAGKEIWRELFREQSEVVVWVIWSRSYSWFSISQMKIAIADDQWRSTVAAYGKIRSHQRHLLDWDSFLVLDLTRQRFLRNDHHENTRGKTNLRLARGTTGKQIDSTGPVLLLLLLGIEAWSSRALLFEMMRSTEPISLSLAFFSSALFNYCWHARWVALCSACTTVW